jgi:hypothetical protein
VTLGGFLFDRFGHIPEEGEQLSVGGWKLKVVEMDKRRVAKVVARNEDSDEPAASSPSPEESERTGDDDRPSDGAGRGDRGQMVTGGGGPMSGPGGPGRSG